MTKYRENNREVLRQYQQDYRHQNKPNYLASQRKSQAGRRERIRTGKGTLRQFLASVLHSTSKQTARKHPVPFLIDVEFLLRLWDVQKGKCALSGMDMATRKQDLKSASIDRRDSTGSYSEDNVQLVCRWVNLAKGNRPDHEMTAIISELRQR